MELSENEIIYDIAFGAVDIAMATDSVIVPISMEQYGKRFVINIGSNFIPTDKVDSTRELRDRMASLKYAIWEKEGITCRADILHMIMGINLCKREFLNGQGMIYMRRLRMYGFLSVKENILKYLEICGTLISQRRIVLW